MWYEEKIERRGIERRSGENVDFGPRAFCRSLDSEMKITFFFFNIFYLYTNIVYKHKLFYQIYKQFKFKHQ